MVIGIDTYRARNVFSGFVASLNNIKEGTEPHFTKWYSQAKQHPTKDQLYNNLHIYMINALRKYYEENGKYPHIVVVYRDGVNADGMKAVKDHEIAQIRNAFKSISMDFNPKLIFLVVKKRVDARFFYRGNNNFLENPKTGTSISTGIIRNTDREFYLISQATNQGTVNPTLYQVLENDCTKIYIRHLQKLTFALTHMYYNWPGPIRVPAPCHYARKLAYLVGESLDREPHPRLTDKLFYL